MKNVLILGAGRVSRPCIMHLLEHTDVIITVVDTSAQNAALATAGHPRTRVIEGDALDLAPDLIRDSDAVISLLPAAYQPGIARLCVSAKKSMVHSSYVNDEQRALHEDAARDRVLILGEMGVDPGVDHMLAVKAISDARSRGGEVTGFYSWCGALPAAEANTNPFGYKFCKRQIAHT